MDSGFQQMLEGHRGAIYCLAQGGAYLFSGGEDAGVKTWHYVNERFEPLAELRSHTAPVQAIRSVGTTLVTADRSGQVGMWSLEAETAGQLTRSFSTGHT